MFVGVQLRRAATVDFDVSDGTIHDAPHLSKQFLGTVIHMLRGRHEILHIS
jgi:hypothetical protein